MEKSLKRLLSFAVALVMVLGMVPFNGLQVFAVENGGAVAKVGNTEYATIDDAIAAWTNGTTLTLLADVTLTDVIKLSSTEYHILDLGTYTMTAASKKDAIQIENNGRTSASYALDIKADATNPGGITATGKAVVRTTGKSGVKDRPIIRFYNGTFNGSYIVYHSGSNGTNSPQFNFYGGEYNGTIYTNRTINIFEGGTFNGSLMMSVDSSAYTLIKGGTFKQLSNLYMSALNSGKFTIGSTKGVYDKEVYINDDGFYVVAAAEPSEGFEAAVATTPGTNDYLAYSKVKTEEVLKYTDAKLALEKNKTATVTVYTEELDLAGTSFTGTIVVPTGHSLTITNAPENLKVEGEGTVTIVKPVAQIGEEEYETLEAAFAAAAEGDTIVLLADAAPALTSQRAITKAAVIDLNGKTLTLTEDDLYFGTTTFENGNIVVAPSVKPSTAVFWMFKDQTLTFDAVKLTATGVTGTYLIGLDGNNADLNLLNGSEIYINNETALDLDVICVNASTGNDIVIDKSKVTVNNLDGRVFFRGNYTVSGNSDIDLSGITKAGFRIEAGQTLTIQDTATVDIAGAPRDGGIHLTDTTSVYTKADTATVNATINAPVVEPTGTITYGFTSQTGIWGETTNNASESMVVELYYGETKIASTALNNIGGIIDGDVYVTWSIPFAGSTDEYWTVQWEEGYPNKNAQPTKVVLVVDGTAVAENAVQMNGPDNLNPVVWDELDYFKVPVAQIGDTQYTDLHEAMVACKSGETLLLIADVDLAGTEWEPVSFKGTFDGQNHTISNLTISKPGVSNTGFITSLNGTFKNVTFTNPTVTGGENTGVVAGRAGGSAALAENITVNGTIKVEVTHSGYARTAVIVGGWAYGNYKNITVDGGDKAVSYVKHTGGGDGRYVAGIVGHADDVESYVNCIVKNITIDGDWLCGAIAGPGPSDGLASGCAVENVDIHANYSGGMFGWYYGDGTIENSSVKNVAFTAGTNNNGAIGGYSANPDANVVNVTIENVTNGGKALLEHVAQINGTYYFTLADAFAAAQDGDEVTILQAGTYALTTSGKSITITGAVDGVVFDNIGKKNMGGANVTFNNVTFDYYPNVDYTGLQHSGNLVYNNCTFNGQVFLYGVSETFTGCTFNQNSADSYNVWTYTADVVNFNGCTFNCAGKSVLVYNESPSEYNKVNVVDCDFVASAPVDGKAAIEMDSSLTAGIALTIDAATTVTGFGSGNVSGNSLWNNKKGNSTDANNDITVVVAGETVLAPVTFVAQIGEEKYETLQAALDAAVAGTGNVTVEILRDVDLTNVDWNPVTVSGPGYPLVTVNGNDKTITGLNDMLFAGTWAGKSGLIINDLTIKDSYIENDVNDSKGNIGVGAFIGYPQASATITLNNCHLVDSTVSGGHWTGGLIGMAGGYNGNDGPVFMNLTIIGCSVTGSTITGKGSAGGVIGHGSCAAWTNVVIEDTTVSGNTITSTGSSTNKAGSVMGTIGAAGRPATAAGETKTGGASVSATTSGNTVTSGGTTITTIYGRQGTETGLLTVTGGTYEAYPIEEHVSYAAPEAGYKIVENENGTYGLAECEYVAQVGDKKYEFLQAAIDAAGEGDTVKLLKSIVLTDDDIVKVGSYGVMVNVEGKSITLDMNGKTIDVNYAGGKYLYAVILVADGAELIVTGDGTIDISENGRNVAYMFWKRGTTGALTIKNGTYHMNDAEDSMVYTNGHEIVTVEGGNFTLDTYGTRENRAPWIFNVQGAGDHCVIVTGGTYNADINRQHWSNEAVVPKTHYVVKNSDNTWTVMEGAVAYVNEGMLTGPFFAPKDVGYATLQEALDAAKGEKDIVINLLADAVLDITAWETLAIGGENTETITINGNGKTLTFNKLNSDWNHVATNNDAKLILNNMTITDSGYNNGPWNRYDLNFGCDVELNEVTSTKALAFKADATLNTVTVNETGDNYAIWVQANGQTVTIDSLTVNSAGRGIKIDNQYVAEAAKVTLNVSNATFTTAKKAAIMVKNPAGADITVSNVDISNVAADTENVVWNDEDSVAYFNMITVTGGTKAQEGEFPVVVKDAEGNILGYYKTLADAIDAAGEYETVMLLANTTETVAIESGKTVVIDLNSMTLNGSILAPNADLTVTNGAIMNTNSGVSGLEINAGKLTLTNVNIDSARHAVRIDGAVEAVIDGGTYRSAIGEGTGTYHAVNVSGDAVVTIKDGTFVGPKGTTADSGSAVNAQAGAVVNIEGGSFSGGKNNTLSAKGTLTLTGGTYDQDPSAYCAPGYKAVNNDGTYGVVVNEDIVAWNMQTGEEYETVAEALLAAKENETVQLLADSDETGAVIIIRNKRALDLNGHTLTADEIMTSSTGARIEDSANGKGLLKVGREYLTLVSNDQMLVWIEEDGGYRFAAATFTQKVVNKGNGTAQFRFYLNGEDPNYIIANELADGNGDNDGLQLRIKMTYQNKKGTTTTLYFDFPSGDVVDYGTGWPNLYLWMNITGLDTVSGVTFAAVLCNGTVEVAGAAQSY